MNERTKACAISKATKDAVYKRDRGQCVLAVSPAYPKRITYREARAGLA